MLLRPTHLLALLLALSVVATGVVFTSGTVDTDRIAEALPRQLDWRTAPAVAAFDPTSGLAGRSRRYVNTALVERDVERAARALVAGRPAGIPQRLASARRHAARADVAHALSGVPSRELELSIRTVRPRDAADPWRAKVAIDVRDVAGTESPFIKPATTLEFVMRPAVDVEQAIAGRWNVEQVKLTRGGLLLLDREVVYERRGALAVAAPRSARPLASTVMSELSTMLPKLERDYPGLRDGDRGIFVVLVSARRGSHRALAQVDERTFKGDIAGIASYGSVVALNLRSMHGMMEIERRSLLRHELAHVVTTELTRGTHDSWSEGLAEWEGDHEIVRTGTHYVVNTEAVDALQSGRIELDEFLYEDKDFEQRDGVEVWVQYRLGSIVVDYVHKQHGRAKARRLWRLLADGVEPRVAVRRALGMSPAAFRDGVAAWARSHRSWHG